MYRVIRARSAALCRTGGALPCVRVVCADGARVPKRRRTDGAVRIADPAGSRLDRGCGDQRPRGSRRSLAPRPSRASGEPPRRQPMGASGHARSGLPLSQGLSHRGQRAWRCGGRLDAEPRLLRRTDTDPFRLHAHRAARVVEAPGDRPHLGTGLAWHHGPRRRRSRMAERTLDLDDQRTRHALARPESAGTDSPRRHPSRPRRTPTDELWRCGERPYGTR